MTSARGKLRNLQLLQELSLRKKCTASYASGGTEPGVPVSIDSLSLVLHEPRVTEHPALKDQNIWQMFKLKIITVKDKWPLTHFKLLNPCFRHPILLDMHLLYSIISFKKS